MVVLILHVLPQTLGHGLNETPGIGQLLLYSINGILEYDPFVDTSFMTPLSGEGVGHVDKCGVDTIRHVGVDTIRR